MTVVQSNTKECKVALLSGGLSGEREISIASGKGAHTALVEAGYEVTCLDPSRPEDLKALIDGNFDVVFLCLHGRYGEDGVIQGFLELLDIPYTGSGVWSSATAMNKSKAKQAYEAASLPTPPSITLHRGDVIDVAAIIAAVGEHSVVKAASEGSTLGIYLIDEAAALEPAILQAMHLDNDVVVEKYISGREFTVVVLGNEDAEALPIIEIIPAHGFYDFEAKYAPGGSEHICPAKISEELAKTMQRLAVKAHKALECAGVSRTDFIVDDSQICWILETNTIPGMTETSLLPDAARAAGMTFPEVCEKLIDLALERHRSLKLQ